ncbi:hypothetical protein BD413DRAFT_617963 [Trametes elegans]|nr:hypothetical protein BD413DRAFT_617963 [Trametes elegans]
MPHFLRGRSIRIVGRVAAQVLSAFRGAGNHPDDHHANGNATHGAGSTNIQVPSDSSGTMVEDVDENPSSDSTLDSEGWYDSDSVATLVDENDSIVEDALAEEGQQASEPVEGPAFLPPEPRADPILEDALPEIQNATLVPGQSVSGSSTSVHDALDDAIPGRPARDIQANGSSLSSRRVASGHAADGPQEQVFPLPSTSCPPFTSIHGNPHERAQTFEASASGSRKRARVDRDGENEVDDATQPAAGPSTSNGGMPSARPKKRRHFSDASLYIPRPRPQCCRESCLTRRNVRRILAEPMRQEEDEDNWSTTAQAGSSDGDVSSEIEELARARRRRKDRKRAREEDGEPNQDGPGRSDPKRRKRGER